MTSAGLDSTMDKTMNSKIRSFKSAFFSATQFTLGFIILLLAGQVQAADLDDISIQIIGLDQVPNEALSEIPLPSPGTVSITDMQGDVIFNKPLASGTSSAISDINNPVSAPVAGGGQDTNGTAGGGTGP